MMSARTAIPHTPAKAAANCVYRSPLVLRRFWWQWHALNLSLKPVQPCIIGQRLVWIVRQHATPPLRIQRSVTAEQAS